MNQARLDQVVAGADRKSVQREPGLPEGSPAPGLLQLKEIRRQQRKRSFRPNGKGITLKTSKAVIVSRT